MVGAPELWGGDNRFQIAWRQKEGVLGPDAPGSGRLLEHCHGFCNVGMARLDRA
jgi:hypothetical protein